MFPLDNATIGVSLILVMGGVPAMIPIDDNDSITNRSPSEFLTVTNGAYP